MISKKCIGFAGVLILSGCMSLEERLSCSNPRIRANAELELVRESRARGDLEQRIAAINRINDVGILTSIATMSDADFTPDGEAATKRLKNDDRALLDSNALFPL